MTMVIMVAVGFVLFISFKKSIINLSFPWSVDIG